MPYNPSVPVANILRLALDEVNAVPYAVTARWVFYRLLQAAVLGGKGDYKRLLSYLSKARKQWYGGWRPDTLTDDTRAALLMERTGLYNLHIRGFGFTSPDEWRQRLQAELNCPLDRWATQPQYVEIWFEAAAMVSQFRFYANDNIPLLAFHGDVSIPAKWDAARRLARRWREMRKPIHVMYYGDLDEKGLQIPLSARDDVRQMMVDALYLEGTLLTSAERQADYREMLDNFTWTRVGLNDDQIDRYGILENPDRPGSYQWEGVDDDAAQELIGLANDAVVAFSQVADREDRVTGQFRDYMEDFTVEEGDDDDAGPA